MNVFFIVLALVAGAAISFQAAVNSSLASGLGGQPLMASLFNFVIGSLCLLAVALVQADWQTVYAQAGQQPLWRWTGGAIGAAFVFSATLLAPKLGVTNMVFLLVIGQLTTGMVIDHYGLMQMPIRAVAWWKFAGIGVMVLGLTLFMFGDRWFKA